MRADKTKTRKETRRNASDNSTTMSSDFLSEAYFDEIFERFNATLRIMKKELPAVSYIAITKNDPYSVLISTLLSLRTKDDVTLRAAEALLSRARDAESMLRLTQNEIETLIYPVGFYKTKAKNILAISEKLCNEFQGKVPSSVERLMSLPGVGLKTANLTLNLGFGINAICVDCHVHQIANRMGWVNTKTPEETEKALRGIMPVKYWIPLNEMLVSYGQEVCTSVSPKCSLCPENGRCAKAGVERSR